MVNRIITIIMLCIGFAANTQDAEPVTWSAKTEMSSPTEGTLIVKGTIAPGWHIYGTQLPEGGPKPTTISYSGSKGVEFEGKTAVSPAPVKEKDQMFMMELTTWENSVTFRQKFKVTDPESARIVVKATYMSCDNMNCMPPKTKRINVKIQ